MTDIGSDRAWRIREHVLNGDTDLANHKALLAVVDKCEQMRAETAGIPGGVGHFIANEFETVIAKALGLTSESSGSMGASSEPADV